METFEKTKTTNDEAGNCRKLHNEVLHNVLLSKYYDDKMRIRWVGHVACIGEDEIRMQNSGWKAKDKATIRKT
jgi:hypothetical protein